MAAAVNWSGVGRRDDSIFLSVFPKPNYTTPTPEATPNIGTISSPGRSFGGFNAPENTATDAIRLTRAWSTATRFLTLQAGLVNKGVTLNQDIIEAVRLLLQSQTTQKELLAWYSNAIGVHYRSFILPELHSWQHPIALTKISEAVHSTIQILQQTQAHYLNQLEQLAHQSKDRETHRLLRDFKAHVKRNLHTLVLHSLPQQRLQKSLASFIFQHMVFSLQGNGNSEKCTKDKQCHCKLDLSGLPLGELHDVGLGGSMGERSFAHAMHRFLQGPAIERRCFEVDWTGHSSVVPKLRSWVQQSLVTAVERALSTLTGNPSLRLAQSDSDQFVSMAINNLGRLRTLALFDYIKSWPDSTGAILDIWEYLNAGNQADKAHVCSSFSEQIRRRLLHAGASTSEILSIYIDVIHAFKALDSRGVLLEKVAMPIRNFLRARDDTVGIIAASFLADVDNEGNVAAADIDKVCPDITVEVATSTLEASRDNKMLDWDDMNWVPEPIDAGPDYKSSESEDTISYILGNLFEPEEFIKEVTTVLAQHLLHATDSEYVKETRLIELFKSRLDSTKLQAAEVMLKDVRDSVSLGKRINPAATYESATPAAPTPREIQAAIPEEGITLQSLYTMFEDRIKRTQFVAAVKLVANKRGDLFYAKRTRLPIPPEPAESANKAKEGRTNFKAQILSSFFWPQLRSNEFELPQVLVPFKEQFEQRFGALGSQRKLQFRPALARVSLHLELEDRTIEEFDVPGWRASVIDAFTTYSFEAEDMPALTYDDTVGLTIEQLMEVLRMDEELVRDALSFWQGKGVLYQRAPGSYGVLERLDMDIGATAHQAQQPSEHVSAVVSQDAMLRENALMFETFIANMLRNQGAKEIGGMMGITNFMKMVLPTFTYGDEEVKWLLGEMEGKGMVSNIGDVWAVV